MMKNLLFIMSLFILSFEGFSQTQQFFDSPFGGGGGFTPGWTFAKVNDLNNMLSQAHIPQVVPVVRILLPGVPQADNEFHVFTVLPLTSISPARGEKRYK